MSNINKQFRPSEAPRGTLNREAWAAAQTARWKAVAFDGDKPIAAEELAQRALNRLSPKARRITGMLRQTDPKIVAEVLAAFDKAGTLKIPFRAA